MAEYIDKQAPIKFIDSCLLHEDKLQGVEKETLLSVKRQIEAIPTADVRPVVRGRWEMDSRSMYSCSCCGQSAPYDVQADIIEYWPHLNYCPNCGADMRGSNAE